MVSISWGVGVIEFQALVKHLGNNVNVSFIRPELTYKTYVYNKTLT